MAAVDRSALPPGDRRGGPSTSCGRARRRRPRFALDTETTSLDPLTADLVGLSFCCDDEVAWYVPVGHDRPVEPQLPWERVRARARSDPRGPGSRQDRSEPQVRPQGARRHGVRAGRDRRRHPARRLPAGARPPLPQARRPRPGPPRAPDDLVSSEARGRTAPASPRCRSTAPATTRPRTPTWPGCSTGSSPRGSTSRASTRSTASSSCR